MKNKATVIWFIVAASLILTGSMTFVGVMNVLEWDFKKLSTVEYETNSYDITENCENITVMADTSNVKLVPSENGEVKVVCRETSGIKHLVKVVDSTLVIEQQDTRRWYEHIQIGFALSEITVYLPSGEYGALDVKSSTGNVDIESAFKFGSIDISGSTGKARCLASASGEVNIKLSTGKILLENISAGALDLETTTGGVEATGISCEGKISIEVSTGKVSLTDVSCAALDSRGGTGNVSLKNVIAAGKLSIERSTGNVRFDGCDAAEIFVLTDTGSVKGSLLSDKVFIVRSDTGNISVPKTVSGGRCEIKTDTGNIKITIN